MKMEIIIEYEDEISDLVSGGCKIGLHLDPSSVSDTMQIQDQKTLTMKV